MPEAHEPFVALLDALDEVGDVLLALDPAQHPQHLLVRASMQWAIQSRDSRRDRGVGIDL